MQSLIVDAALIPHQETSLGGTQSSNLQQILDNLRTPHLKAWLSKAQALEGKTLSEESLNTPLEEAIRLCLAPSSEASQISNGLTGQAHALALESLPEEAARTTPIQGWALISLCHWHVNSGQVFMLEAEPLDETSSETLRVELTPFFAQVGISIFKYMPGVWLARSELFHALPTTSLFRAMGQEVEPWLVGNTLAFPKERMHHSQSLKRLQSEVQMLLYQHAINEHRAAPLNSIWFSDTGTSCSDTQQIRWLSNINEHPHQETLSPNQIWVSDHLRMSSKQGEWRSWAQTLERMDAQLFGEQNAVAFERLIFCGPQSAKVWLRRPRNGLGSFLSSLRASVFSRSTLSSIFHEN
jgi:hypothetical protein